MSNLNLSVPDLSEMKPRITVFGVGGGGCNAVNNMIESNLSGVDFVVANTDAQALAKSPCEKRIQMGAKVTQGLGAGSQPEIGAAAAEEALAEIVDHLSGSHMVFITAGMGGGTGTGAAPVIARAAKEERILTVGVVTKPFNFEGKRRMAIAERGIESLAAHVDTLIVIPNQNLFRVANEKTSFTAAFAMADQVLYSGVASITELMTKEGLINLDFADVRTVMAEMGKAMMGTGEASGESRAIEAAEAAIANPLLDDVELTGARGVLISIAGGADLTLYEVDEAASRIREEVDEDANIIVGATIEDELEGTMRVSVVATGLNAEAMAAAPPAEREEPHEAPAFVPLPGVGDPGLEAETVADGEDAPHSEAAPSEEGRPAETTDEIPAPAPAGMRREEPGAPAAGRPDAGQRPVAPQVPDLADFPAPVRDNALRKAEQISSVAKSGRNLRKSLLDRLSQHLPFGGHEKADETPAPRAAAEPRPHQPAPQAPAVKPAVEGGQDEYDIPAFLRRQQN
ncbi:MAG TPA: cell division protein FtsZ [Thermopetrobacter sp.]|nr:cell division protein FtsZ [Thermopetrobacter sp.]